MIQDLAPDGAAVQVARPLCGYERLDIRWREEPLVSWDVIEPRKSEDLLDFGVLLPNFREQCPQLRMTLVSAAVGEWTAVPMAQIRHEVNSQCPVLAAGVIAEASEW